MSASRLEVGQGRTYEVVAGAGPTLEDLEEEDTGRRGISRSYRGITMRFKDEDEFQAFKRWIDESYERESIVQRSM